MITYLSRTEVAKRIGVQPDTLNRYELPPADATGGASAKGPRLLWLPETIDRWNAARPGRGRKLGRARV